MELNSELDRLQKYAPIDAELKRAEIKYPHYPSDIFQQLAIMQEEAGEVTKAVLQYHYEGGSFENIKEEIIQTAAMCMRMLQVLTPCKRIKKVCPKCGSTNVGMFSSDDDWCNDCHSCFPGE